MFDFVHASESQDEVDIRVYKGATEIKDGSVYEGEWVNGKRDGQGVLIQIDGTRYEGMFENNQFHGVGCQTFANGDRYTGEWFYDKKHGKG